MTKGDLKRFEIKADRKRYGNAAGPIRNQQMLDWGPDLVVAFAGGTGTAGMAWSRWRAGRRAGHLAVKHCGRMSGVE
jgi:hypothetical protein